MKEGSPFAILFSPLDWLDGPLVGAGLTPGAVGSAAPVPAAAACSRAGFGLGFQRHVGFGLKHEQA